MVISHKVEYYADIENDVAEYLITWKIFMVLLKEKTHWKNSKKQYYLFIDNCFIWIKVWQLIGWLILCSQAPHCSNPLKLGVGL